MLRSDYAGQNCSIARALEVVGERWTILVLRETFLGNYRFDTIQRNLGVARNVLQARLERLVEAKILKKVRYQERPPRYEYRLTAKGIDLWPVVVALLKWGDRYEAPGGPPVLLVHKQCGGQLDDRRRCRECGAELEAREVEALRGPGMRAAATAYR
jgi:DNA-binding HxlR family transcriptional regulator